MKLYIQIENGQPINHPIEEGNFKSAFPKVDINNLPPEWALFNRVQQPTDLLTSPFQNAVSSYGLMADGTTWQDVWTAQPMSDQEKADKIALYQSMPPGPNQTLNTETLVWSPSTPMPQDGQTYLWNNATGEWIVPPPKPTDGKKYYYDFTNGCWVAIPS